MPLGDPVLSEAAELFLAELTEDLRTDCWNVLMTRVVNQTAQQGTINSRGQTELFVQGWHYRYRMLNANAVRIDTVFFSPSNPHHPMNRLGFIPPE